MKNKDNRKEKAAELRSQAEAKLSERKKNDAPSPATEADARRLVHELEVHQIELEMQNGELVQARAEVEELLSQYTDLYDFAPVGYFTLARDSTIDQVNLVGANLLGVERGALVKRRFGLFVSTESRPIFNDFLEKVFSASGSKETCQVTLMKTGHTPLWAHIEATCFEDGQECRAVVSDITERKKAEEELQRSEQSFKSISENAHDGIIVALGNGAYIYANKRASAITGYSINEILKTGIEGLTHPDEILRLSERRKKILAGENVPNQYEAVIIHKNGNAVPIEITSARTLWYGQVADIFVFRDITERKRAEAALGKSEERFRMAAESTSDCVWERDIKKDSVDWFGDIDSLLGYKQDEFPRTIEAWGKAIHPEDRDKVMVLLYKHIIEHTPYDAKYRVVKKDGSIAFWVDRGTAVYDENGKIYKMFGAVKDITNSESMKEALLRINKAVEGSSDAIGISDPQGNHFYHNQAFTDLFEYTAEELDAAGGGPAAFASKDVARKVFDTIMGGGSWSGELEMVSKSGRKFPVMLRADAIKNDAGKVIGLVGVHTDITKRKQAEEALRVSELKYRSLVEQSLLGILIIQDAHIVYMNNVMVEKSGYSIDEMISLSPEQVRGLIHPDDRDLVWNRMFSRLSGNPEMASYECRFVVRSGSIYWVDMNTSVIEYLGKPAIQIFIVDITERKRAEEALHDSEERFRSLVEKSSDVMIIISRDSIISYVSPTVRTVFNRDSSELFGKSAFDFATEFIHPDDVNAVMKAFAGCLEKPGAEKQVECRFRLLDGSWLNLETIGKNQLDNPSIQGLVVTIRDITERKLAEKKIQSQLDELKRWQDVMLGREDRVQELKREVNEICRRMGEAVRYKSQEKAPADPGAGIKEHK